MSLAEIRGFVRACARKSAEDQISFVVGIAVGAQGDSKSIKKAINEFEKARKSLSLQPTLPKMIKSPVEKQDS